jgi:hypothetical protein
MSRADVTRVTRQRPAAGMLASALLGLSLSGGCAPDFIEQWEVTKPRLLTAKVEIEGDTEGRTRPQPGESFSIRYFMMSPERPQAGFTAATSVCVGTLLTNGTLACLEEVPLPLETQPYEGNDQLLLNGLLVPPLPADLPDEVEDSLNISLFGGMCANGDAERVPGSQLSQDPVTHSFQCTNNDDAEYKTPLFFALAIGLDLGRPGDLNHHPSFACKEDDADSACVNGVEHELEDDQTITTPGAILLAFPKDVAGDGPREQLWEPWDLAEELPWDNCAEAPESMPKLRADTEDYKIYVRLNPSDREDYERVIHSNEGDKVEMRREEPVISHALTTHGGKLDSYSSVVTTEDLDSEAEIDVEYTPPRQSDEEGMQIGESGRLVRFYFTLRDQRGGVDFTTRELCVLPPQD